MGTDWRCIRRRTQSNTLPCPKLGGPFDPERLPGSALKPTAATNAVPRKIRQTGIGAVTVRTAEAEGPPAGRHPVRTTRRAPA